MKQKNLTPIAQSAMSKDIWIEAIHSEPEFHTSKDGAMFEINTGNTHTHRFKHSEIERTGGDEEQSYILHKNGSYYCFDIGLDELSGKLESASVKSGKNCIDLKDNSSFKRFKKDDLLTPSEIMDVFKFKKPSNGPLKLHFISLYSSVYHREASLASQTVPLTETSGKKETNYCINGNYSTVLDKDEFLEMIKAARKADIKEIDYTARTLYLSEYYQNNKKTLPKKLVRSPRLKNSTLVSVDVVEPRQTVEKPAAKMFSIYKL